MKIAIACRTPWFWRQWDPQDPELVVMEIREPHQLNLSDLEAFQPKYIFFPHWSAKVSPEIFERFECVCFHAAPVPFGRGGSPVQNMIAAGFEVTTISALRMVEEFDAGPVYLCREMSLLGGGDEIFIRLSREICAMIYEFLRSELVPKAQVGDATTFKRRKPAQSRIPQDLQLDRLFDHIRMLDVTGYPHAFMDFGKYRLEFTRPALTVDGIRCDVLITEHDEVSE